MTKFIELEDCYRGQVCGTLLVNIDTISAIHVNANVLYLMGTHGEGNGLVHITSDSMDKLVNVLTEYMEVVE